MITPIQIVSMIGLLSISAAMAFPSAKGREAIIQAEKVEEGKHTQNTKTWKDYRRSRDGQPYTRLAEGLKGSMIMKAGGSVEGHDIQGTFQPSFTVAPNGDYLVFAQGRIGSDEDKAPKTLLMVRSKDGGKTWSQPESIATPRGSFFSINSFTDRVNNRIHVLFKNNRAWQISSKDNGVSWSAWDSKNVSRGFGIGEKIWQQKRVKSSIFLGQAIQLQRGQKNGRIVLGGIHKYNTIDQCPVAIWSDDRGQSWQYGKGFPGFTRHRGMSEPTIAELSNGHLMMITRDGNREKRSYSISKNYGASWGPVKKSEALPAPGCFGAFCSMTANLEGHKKHVLLFSSPAEKSRRSGKIYFSLDDGQTWKSKLLDAGLFSYSTISPLRKGEFVVSYSKGWHGSRGIYFVKTDLNWLLGLEPEAAEGQTDTKK